MAKQIFPQTKDSNVLLQDITSGHIDSDDKTLSDWISNNTDAEANITTNAKAISTRFGANMLNALLECFYTGPADATATQASITNNNKITNSGYFVTGVAGTVSYEVGTKIPSGTNLLTLISTASKNDNGAISKIAYNGGSGTTEPGTTVNIGSVNIVFKKWDGSQWTETTEVAGNVTSLVTTGQVGKISISSSANATSIEDLYVSEGQTSTGRIQFITSSSAGSTVTFAEGTEIAGASGGKFVGTESTISITGVSGNSTKAAEKILTFNAPSTGTYYTGIGYRNVFVGTLDSYTSDSNTLTTLSGNGARTNATIETVNINSISGAHTISCKSDDKYIYIAVPSGNTPTSGHYQSTGSAEQDAKFKRIGTCSVNGANNMYPTNYDIFVVINASSNAAIPITFDGTFKFTL